MLTAQVGYVNFVVWFDANLLYLMYRDVTSYHQKEISARFSVILHQML